MEQPDVYLHDAPMGGSTTDILPGMVHVTRYQMKYEPGSTDEKVLCRYIEMLPHEYKLTMFDRTVFEQKPFMHASTYSSYEDFQRNASGAVVWYQGQIVSSASSFLSWKTSWSWIL